MKGWYFEISIHQKVNCFWRLSDFHVVDANFSFQSYKKETYLIYSFFKIDFDLLTMQLIYLRFFFESGDDGFVPGYWNFFDISGEDVQFPIKLKQIVLRMYNTEKEDRQDQSFDHIFYRLSNNRTLKLIYDHVKIYLPSLAAYFITTD